MAESKAVPNDDGSSAIYALLAAAIETQKNELKLQGTVADVSRDWATGAFWNVQSGDYILSYFADQMKGKTGDDLARAQANYQLAQTTVSNLNQQYSNVVQGGNTAMTSLTQVESQALQYCQIVEQFMDGATRNIEALAGG